MVPLSVIQQRPQHRRAPICLPPTTPNTQVPETYAGMVTKRLVFGDWDPAELVSQTAGNAFFEVEEEQGQQDLHFAVAVTIIRRPNMTSETIVLMARAWRTREQRAVVEYLARKQRRVEAGNDECAEPVSWQSFEEHFQVEATFMRQSFVCSRI